ncbi:zinc ribbon domain-containing protein [Kitasatospora sp. GP82]|uniref:zinc ribbon domain-containing protein n=1 Tax=Kitasatospora sp. GP82 TaxID=3035089 RepID=UPI0024758BAA|nr:zinc ribbon domain-containing protein [Kitasatospora sp. GP82]
MSPALAPAVGRIVAADGLAGANWGSARDSAFQRAIGNAQRRFNRCARCTSYVCARCWSPEQGLCHNCAPDTAAEAVAAQRRGLNGMASEQDYAQGRQAGRSYDVTTPRQLVCPQCQAETHGTPFCPGCGHRLAAQVRCTSCNSPLPDAAAFRPGCGTRR